VKRRFYLKQHKRVNTFIPWIDPPGFIEMNESVASFLIFRIKIRLLRGKLATWRTDAEAILLLVTMPLLFGATLSACVN